MTNLQIRLAVEIGRTGSISIAAQTLGISQPNASGSLQKLEKELGCTLFDRNHNGVIPTEQGRLFLRHSEKLLQEYEALQSVRNYGQMTRLRVGGMSYSPPIDAFIRFCSELGEVPEADLSCNSYSFPEGLKGLRDGDLDIMIGFAARNNLSGIEKICEEEHFSFQIHHILKACVRLRADHPLLQGNLLDGSLESLSRLGAYPHVDYRQDNALLDNFRLQTNYSLPYLYKIFVDERSARLKMVSETNAYSLGIELPESQLKAYHLVNVPIQSIEVALLSFVREEEKDNESIRHYKDLLDAELAF